MLLVLAHKNQGNTYYLHHILKNFNKSSFFKVVSILPPRFWRQLIGWNY